MHDRPHVAATARVAAVGAINPRCAGLRDHHSPKKIIERRDCALINNIPWLWIWWRVVLTVVAPNLRTRERARVRISRWPAGTKMRTSTRVLEMLHSGENQYQLVSYIHIKYISTSNCRRLWQLYVFSRDMALKQGGSSPDHGVPQFSGHTPSTELSTAAVQ